MILTEQLEATKHLDFDDIACGMHENCPRTASWWGICLRCAAHTPSCDRCRREMAVVIGFLARDVALGCASCEVLLDPTRPGDLFTFVPIGGAS